VDIFDEPIVSVMKIYKLSPEFDNIASSHQFFKKYKIPTQNIKEILDTFEKFDGNMQ
jgi:hypothetical protein